MVYRKDDPHGTETVAYRFSWWYRGCSGAQDDVSQYLLSLCRNRQYTKISTPLVEYKDVFNGYTLGRGQHMYEFFGSSDASVVIRPDLTMPIGRFFGDYEYWIASQVLLPWWRIDEK